MAKLFIGFLLVALAGAGLIFVIGSDPLKSQSSASLTRVYLGNLPLKVEIASTEEARRRGLGGRIGLESDQGMLFAFDRPQTLSFWMKDMRFPIDIIWLDQNYTVIDISKNVRPDSYPTIYSPKIPAQYVLEVNAGISDSYGIDEGTALTFSKNFLSN
jgi:uncharacterized membrane protein (UPF0127 family)